MKLPSLNFKSGSGVSALNIFKHNLGLVLLCAIAIIAVLTGLVIFKEVRKVSQVQTDTSGILDKIVRVNLTQHQALEKQLGDNSSFEPIPVPGADVFGAAPTKKTQ